MSVELLVFTFYMFEFCIWSAHSHNLPPIAEVCSDISWNKPASAALKSPWQLCVGHVCNCALSPLQWCVHTAAVHKIQQKLYMREQTNVIPILIAAAGNKVTYIIKTPNLRTPPTCYVYVLVLDVGQTYACSCMCAAAFCITSSGSLPALQRHQTVLKHLICIVVRSCQTKEAATFLSKCSLDVSELRWKEGGVGPGVVGI